MPPRGPFIGTRSEVARPIDLTMRKEHVILRKHVILEELPTLLAMHATLGRLPGYFQNLGQGSLVRRQVPPAGNATASEIEVPHGQPARRRRPVQPAVH